MHHELFVALLGHTGDVIERRDDGFFVRKDATFLSSSQRTVLDRLLCLGFAFATLDEFVSRASKYPSVYLRALAQGIETLLQRYMDDVVAVEAKLLQHNAVFPVSNLIFELEEFREILPEVCTLVKRLTEGKKASTCVKGAALLSIVHQNTNSGFPRVAKCMQTLLYTCHRVFLKQMMAWMIYGELLDPYAEFFIQKVETNPTNKTMTTTLWHEHFVINLNAVPIEYVSTSVVENVFEIGKAVHILTQADQFTPDEVQKIIKTMSDLALRPIFDALILEHEVRQVRQYVASRLHEEIVVKMNFVEYCMVLKDFFLLSRGEVFQTFIERSFQRMLVPPTTRSEDDVNYRIWQDIIDECVPKDDNWSRAFHMELPLQTFALPNFKSIDHVILFNMAPSRNGQCLSVTTKDSNCEELETLPSGSLWWRHAQVNKLLFSSDFSLYWDHKAEPCASHHVSLILRNEGSLGPATFVNGSLELQDPDAVYVTVDLAIQPETLTKMRVMAQIKPSNGGDNTVVASPVVTLSSTNEKPQNLCIRIQYVCQETILPSSKQLVLKRMMVVLVNNVVLLKVPFDLQQVLKLHAITGNYFIGLGMSSLVLLTSWHLQKYPATTSWPTKKDVDTIDKDSSVTTPRILWQSLTLHCTVHWPLQLLVTPELLRSYRHLFQFCFRLKRVAYALELAWKHLSLRAKSTVGFDALFAVGALRLRMSFVVRTLELYFHVFVIQGKFDQFVGQIQTAQDFDRVQRVHETFVASIVKSCFVYSKTVASALDELLSCCWNLVESILLYDRTTELSRDSISRLDQDFFHRFEAFYNVLQNSEARELLFLLDSNGFFATERERRKPQQLPLSHEYDYIFEKRSI